MAEQGFVPYKGKFEYQWYLKKASTILSEGAVIDVIDGFVEICDIARKSHSGVCQKTVTAADADYAETTLIPILVPSNIDSCFKAVVATGTAAATNVGNFYDLGGTPVGSGITLSSSDDDAVLVKEFIDTTHLVVFLNCFKPMKNGIGTEI